MTINDIYDIALYLAEKTDDNTGYADSEYKKQHKKKAEVIIRQAIRSYNLLLNITTPEIDLYGADEELPLPDFPLKNIIPYYVAAILCAHDKESDKYSLLIFEYQQALSHLKFDEEMIDAGDMFSGWE